MKNYIKFLILPFLLSGFLFGKDFFVVLDTSYSLKENIIPIQYDPNSKFFARSNDIYSIKNLKQIGSIKDSSLITINNYIFGLEEKLSNGKVTSTTIKKYNLKKQLIDKKSFDISHFTKQNVGATSLRSGTGKYLILRLEPTANYIILDSNNFKVINTIKEKSAYPEKFDGKYIYFVGTKSHCIVKRNIFNKSRKVLFCDKEGEGIPTITVLKNNLYYENGKKFKKYNLKSKIFDTLINDKRFDSSYKMIYSDDNDRFLFLSQSICTSSSFCYDTRGVIFDAKNNIFIDSFKTKGTMYGGAFFNLSPYKKIILVAKENRYNAPTITKKYYLVSPSKLSHLENMKLKKFYIKRIEDKIGKKFSSSAKVVIFDTDGCKFLDNTVSEYFISFAIIDKNKTYFYLTSSFRNTGKSNNAYIFNGRYKIKFTNGKKILCTHVYGAKKINFNNKELAKSSVLSFPKINLKIGDKIKFIENSGNLQKKQLNMALNIKDIL